MSMDGPRVLQTHDVVYVGEDLCLAVPVLDGTSGDTIGTLDALSVASATVKGVLRIYKPDGTTNVTRDTSVSGEGEKYDSDADSVNDGFKFYIASTVTSGWSSPKMVGYEVEYQDSSTTPTVARLVLRGTLYIVQKPSAGGL